MQTVEAGAAGGGRAAAVLAVSVLVVAAVVAVLMLRDGGDPPSDVPASASQDARAPLAELSISREADAGPVAGEPASAAATADASRPPRPEPSPLAPEPPPAPERAAGNSCKLSLQVLDSPGGLPLTAFEVERSLWLLGELSAPARIHVNHPEGRVEFDGLMCGSFLGIRILPFDRPGKLFGPIVVHEGELKLQLVVGPAATLRVQVVFDSGTPVEGASVSLDRPICDESNLFEHAVWPRIPTDEQGVAEVRDLVAGRYVVSARGAMKSTDLLDLDLAAGVERDVRLVLRDELRPGRLVVRVVDNDGPVPGRTVEVGPGARAHRSDDDEEPRLSASTGRDGCARFESLPPDLYPIFAGFYYDSAQPCAAVREGRETRVEIRLVD
jgi:hypothetical protein